jgi:PadR family transcriptional regulator PadR
MLSKAMVAASTKPMILSILLGGEDYGYRILQRVKEMSGGTMTWSDNMLYPFLKRLEDDGLLAARWQLSEEGRLRKYYRITDAGRKELEVERRQWTEVNKALSALWEPLPSLD